MVVYYPEFRPYKFGSILQIDNLCDGLFVAEHDDEFWSSIDPGIDTNVVVPYEFGFLIGYLNIEETHEPKINGLLDIVLSALNNSVRSQDKKEPSKKRILIWLILGVI